MEKSELVVELGVEEIPSSMIEEASRQFADILLESLKGQRLATGLVTRWYTPRRIIVGIRDIPLRQDDLSETIIGPPKSVAYDSAGSPTKAALAFAQKNAVPVSRIKITQTPKGAYLAIVRKVRGEQTHKLLKRLIPTSIAKIQFLKPCTSRIGSFRFARPLRWIVAIFAGKTVRFEYRGYHCVQLYRGTPVPWKIQNSGRFFGFFLRERCCENSVLVDPAERLTQIRSGLQRAAELAADASSMIRIF